MSVVLKADNSFLIEDAKYSYLENNYLSGVSSIVITNSDAFTMSFGSSTTQFDITNPSGTTFRYTYDGTGTDPNIGKYFSVGDYIIVNAQNFDAANNDTFQITGVGASYFEVTNALGVAESNKTIGTGTITKAVYIIFGNFGAETCEIIKVSAVTAATHTLSLTTATKFAHAESTKVTVVPYNQVIFYYTSTATFAATNPVSGYLDVQCDDVYTRVTDSSNTTGFGWYKFYNSTTENLSAASSAIPYGGYNEYSAKKLIDRFFSQLNNKENKLITEDEAFSYLNEAYSVTRNHLNLVNNEYSVSDEYDIDVVADTKEYSLPSDFSDIVSVYWGSNRWELDPIALRDVPNFDAWSWLETKYYLRGIYIGFSPTPTTDRTYTIRYKTKTTALTSLYDNIDLPDNNFYLLVDYMMYKVAPKLKSVDGESHLRNYMLQLETMKLTSFKRDNNRATFGIDRSAYI